MLNKSEYALVWSEAYVKQELSNHSLHSTGFRQIVTILSWSEGAMKFISKVLYLTSSINSQVCTVFELIFISLFIFKLDPCIFLSDIFIWTIFLMLSSILQHISFHWFIFNSSWIHPHCAVLMLAQFSFALYSLHLSWIKLNYILHIHKIHSYFLVFSIFLICIILCIILFIFSQKCRVLVSSQFLHLTTQFP
jgi:hypothetical protein